MTTRITREEFQATLPTLIEDILASARKYEVPENAMKWFETQRIQRKM